jgi:hypothetical protein
MIIGRFILILEIGSNCCCTPAVVSGGTRSWTDKTPTIPAGSVIVAPTKDHSAASKVMDVEEIQVTRSAALVQYGKYSTANIIWNSSLFIYWTSKKVVVQK